MAKGGVQPGSPARGGNKPGSGRPKGAINKKSLTVAQYLESVGFDVLGELVKSAKSLDEGVALRAKCELASFVYPKLRSVEMKAQVTTVTTQRDAEAASDRALLEALAALQQDDSNHDAVH